MNGPAEKSGAKGTPIQQVIIVAPHFRTGRASSQLIRWPVWSL